MNCIRFGAKKAFKAFFGRNSSGSSSFAINKTCVLYINIHGIGAKPKPATVVIIHSITYNSFSEIIIFFVLLSCMYSLLSSLNVSHLVKKVLINVQMVTVNQHMHCQCTLSNIHLIFSVGYVNVREWTASH